MYLKIQSQNCTILQLLTVVTCTISSLVIKLISVITEAPESSRKVHTFSEDTDVIKLTAFINICLKHTVPLVDERLQPSKQYIMTEQISIIIKHSLSIITLPATLCLECLTISPLIVHPYFYIICQPWHNMKIKVIPTAFILPDQAHHQC